MRTHQTVHGSFQFMNQILRSKLIYTGRNRSGVTALSFRGLVFFFYLFKLLIILLIKKKIAHNNLLKMTYFQISERPFGQLFLSTLVPGYFAPICVSLRLSKTNLSCLDGTQTNLVLSRIDFIQFQTNLILSK